jgi:hypothetical protein
MFKFIKSSIFLLGMLRASSLCLATDYDWRPGSEISTDSNSRSSEEDDVITQKTHFIEWLQGKLLFAVNVVINDGQVSIGTLRNLLANTAQVTAASFGGPGWTFNNNPPSP